MTDFRIAAQRAGPAARHVHQREIECSFFFKSRRIGKPAFHAIGIRGETFAQIRKPPRTRFASDDQRVRVAFGEDERFAAGRGARIENLFSGFGRDPPLYRRPIHRSTATLRPAMRTRPSRKAAVAVTSPETTVRAAVSSSPAASSIPVSLNSSAVAGLSTRTAIRGWLWPWRQIACAASAP